MTDVDTSMYANVRPVQVQLDNPLDIQAKVQNLNTLGMQQAQMGRQMQTQNQVRQAYARNTDPNTGQIDQQGFLSDLGRVNPQAAMDYGNQFSASNDAKAKAQAAQVDAAQKTLSITMPAMQHIASMPSEDQKAAAWPGIMKQLAAQGVPMQAVPPQYDKDWLANAMTTGSQMKDHLDSLQAQANIGKAQAETAKTYQDIGMIPLQKNAEAFGSRSPYSTQQDAYNKEVAPVRGSQMAMQQMMDNYKNTTPQGDASLVLNAFKIKFPNAPDVNSLSELQHSENASAQMKNWVSEKMNGIKDPGVRDNLMRDGISTYRANVEGLRDTQQKYQGIAKQNNLPNANFTNEPAIDKTYNKAMALQNDVGPYVPPSDRGGFTGAVGSFVSKFMGSGPSKANAAPPPPRHGTVDGGYVFMGGDPSKQSNWERAN